MSNATTPSDGGDGSPSIIAGISSALGVTFLLIGLGYFCRRFNLFSSESGAGIGAFVGKVALPALLFSAMATVDFSSVDFRLIGAITAGKTLVFILALLFGAFMVSLLRCFTKLSLTLSFATPTGAITAKRGQRLQKAGIFGIFATQSNDFAFGLPVVKVLYPSLIPYLLLTAPVQLLMLNPIGMMMIEIGVSREEDAAAAAAAVEDGRLSTTTSSSSPSSCRKGACTAAKVARSVVTNPLVFMVALGGIWNLAFSSTLPDFLDDLLHTAGEGFTATALFCLGMALVGNIEALRGRGLVQPAILSLLKTFVLPLIVLFILDVMFKDVPDDLRAFGYLYASLPTAYVQLSLSLSLSLSLALALSLSLHSVNAM